jgi:hypothetical protein
VRSRLQGEEDRVFQQWEDDQVRSLLPLLVQKVKILVCSVDQSKNYYRKL